MAPQSHFLSGVDLIGHSLNSTQNTFQQLERLIKKGLNAF